MSIQSDSRGDNGVRAENTAPDAGITRPLAGLKTAEAAFVALLGRGLWPVGLYPRGVKRNTGTTEGKEPFGAKWGLVRWTVDRWKDLVRRFRGAGVGLGLGPGRGPDGAWVIDLEGDGPKAEESRSVLFGGEVIESLGWSSVRGGHQALLADTVRMTAIMGGLASSEVKGKPGVFHFAELPDLELRIGGFLPDGTVKQIQSVVPPTPGTDGTPREWNGVETIADAPESFYAFLEAAGAAASRPVPTATAGATTGPKPPAANRADAWLRKAFENGCGKIAMAPNKTRHATLLAQTRTLGGYLHYGLGFTEGELESRATEAADRAAPERAGDNPRCVRDAIDHGKASPLTLPDELHALAIGENGMSRNGEKGHHEGTGADAGSPDVEVMADGEDEGEVLDLWPTIDPRAFHGLAGEIVSAADPHNEGDRVATLVQFLVAFGNLIGHNAHFVVAATHHHLNLFIALVGMTAVGRKGTSWDVVRWILGGIDPDWKEGRIMGGLVSGEGLIHHVRDPKTEERPVKEGKGPPHASETVVVDPGVTDKRLLVVETEFSRVLKSMGRDSNTLSDVMRQGFDGGDLRTMGKNNGEKATGAHISIIAHVTQADIRRHLSETDTLNGFANRFLWTAVRQSKSLPEGGRLFEVDWSDITTRLRGAVAFARQVGKMTRDPAAAKVWAGLYDDLSAGRPGLLGAVLSRAVPLTMRMACQIALLDRSAVVRAGHLIAALALWDYCEASARFIFGDSLGDPVAEKLLAALKAAPDGLTRRDIANDVFKKNKKSKAIVALLSGLFTARLIHRRTDNATGGRPAERWYAGREPEPPTD